MDDYKVYYKEGFSDNEDDNKTPCLELPLNKSFEWNDETWKVLSLFVDEEGMVVDIGKWMDVGLLQTYYDKWINGQNARGYSDLTPAQRMELEEDSLIFDEKFSVELSIHRTGLKPIHRWTMMFNPIVAVEENSEHELQLLEHYDLGADKFWKVFRFFIPFEKNRKMSISDIENAEIEVTLIPRSQKTFGEPLNIKNAGQEFTIIHPVTKKEHLLKIKEIEWINHNKRHNKSDEREYILGINYTISPELSDEEFSLSDRSGGDGENQPAMIYFKEQQAEDVEPIHTVCSSIYIEPREQLLWKPKFKVKIKNKITLHMNLKEI